MKVVLITGCSSGLGRALARNFHARQFRVFATARTPSALQGLELEGIRTVALDVTSMQSVQQAVAHVVQEAGTVDFLICNAGISRIGPVLEQSMEDIQAVMDTNFLGAIRCAQAVAGTMIQQRSGVIALIGSVSSTLASPYAGLYSASKAAVHSIFTALRMELAPYGVSVSIVEPGAFKSSLVNNNKLEIEHFSGRKSLYARVTEHIEARANASQSHKSTMTAEAVAQQITHQLCQPKGPPTHFLVAGGVWFLKFLGLIQTFVWPGLTDWALNKKFGLSGRW
ncbi:hypothetical protein ABBQ32_009850 [Trebouxia sp. C0010 RCD-2024]